MDNYEYIIASLPVLQQDDVKAGQPVAQELLDEIRALIISLPDAFRKLFYAASDNSQTKRFDMKRCFFIIG